MATIREQGDVLPLFSRIRAHVAKTPLVTRSGALSITLSVGVAVAHAGSTVDSLLERGDLALYQAKNQGRDRVVVATAPPSAAKSGSEPV